MMTVKRNHPTKTPHPTTSWSVPLLILATLPLLVACTGSTSTDTQAGNLATSSTTSPASPTPSSGPTPSAQTQQAEVTDACQDTCQVYDTLDTTHPTLGPVHVRTYGKPITSASDPTRVHPAYAVYQGENLISYYETTGATYSFISAAPTQGTMMWNLHEGHNQDAYGNLYFATDRTIVVLAPTHDGYDQARTLPQGNKPKPAFEIIPFYDENNQPQAGLTINDQGHAHISLGSTDGTTYRYVAITGPLAEDQSSAYFSCSTPEPLCGFTLTP